MAKGRKTGGRAKGTPNKRSQVFAEVLDAEEFCPALAMVKIYRKAWNDYLATKDSESLKIALQAAVGMAPYKFPKLSALKVSGRVDFTDASDEELIKEVKSALAIVENKPA